MVTSNKPVKRKRAGIDVYRALPTIDEEDEDRRVGIILQVP